MKKTVAVAMSGGVDSSYAIIKLKEEGYNVFGVTLKLFGDIPYSPKASCSMKAIKDARNICTSLEVPHRVINVEKVFQEKVVDYFVNSYKKGFTPNPCVICNSTVKWGSLSEKVFSYGADFFATGHYTRVYYSEKRKKHLLSCGLDKSKDQSYYLWALTEEQLSKTLFPLGDMQKEEVKIRVKNYNLKLSEKPESQEICFIPDNDYRNFLKNKFKIEPGNIINSSGEIIGHHEGFPFYTIGQRRGLGISFSERLYVNSIDPIKNEIKLGTFDELYRKELLFTKANFIYIPEENSILKARIRYRGKLQPCKLKNLKNGRFRLNFVEPLWGVCPGQSVVIYDDYNVVGGGIII